MERTILGIRWQALLLVGLSLSIGWGIRGNFGHEWGAAFPGALAAMAAVLISQREDWLRSIAYFAMFGAIGWAFGGSISYMIVISYTHSGHSPSVLYGFFCLFVIGFLWGAVGGAGTVLPAFLSRPRLTEFFVPLTLCFFAWWIGGTLEDAYTPPHGRSPLDWYDTDWPAVCLAIVMVLLRGAFRRKLDEAERLILHMAVGWMLGFVLLTAALHLRMTPPRSDNWSGSVGLTVGMWIYFQRRGLYGLTYASLITGFVGGLGFASATLFKLVEMKSGWTTNWHSVLEQSYGLINGLGIAIMMERLRTRAPQTAEQPAAPRWGDGFAVSFVLLLLTYINLQKEVDDWLSAKAVPAAILFLSMRGWFDLFYALTALGFLLLLREHLRKPLALVPARWLGKGLLLYLALLWWMVIGNFMKALVSFSPERLITEGTIYLNALICTVMALLWTRSALRSQIESTPDFRPLIRHVLTLGCVVMALSVIVDWGIVRALYGETHAGYSALHIRFGPNATTNKK